MKPRLRKMRRRSSPRGEEKIACAFFVTAASCFCASAAVWRLLNSADTSSSTSGCASKYSRTILSISPRCGSEKLCADASAGTPHNASANSADWKLRSEGIGKSSRAKQAKVSRSRLLKRLVVLLAGHRPGADDIVGLDPTGRADGETGLGARGELACRLVVAAQKGGLCRSQIGLRVVALAAIGHRELGIADRRLRFARHRGTQNRNRLVGVSLVIRRHQRLPK